MYKRTDILKFTFLLFVAIALQACYQAMSKETETIPELTTSAESFLLDSISSTFGFGRVATQAEIDRLDIDVRPDGKGLPTGSGVAAKGKLIFATRCLSRSWRCWGD